MGNESLTKSKVIITARDKWQKTGTELFGFRFGKQLIISRNMHTNFGQQNQRVRLSTL